MKKTDFAILALSTLGLASMAQAAVINFNFNDGGAAVGPVASSALVAPAAYTGTIWNDATKGGFNVNGYSVAALLDSDNNATGVGFSISSNAGGSGTGNFNATSAITAQKSYAWSNGGATPLTLNITGLGAGTEWDVYIFSQGDVAGQGGSFTADSEAGTPNAVSTGSLPGAAGVSWVEGSNYVKFSGLTAAAAGGGSIDFSSAEASNVINGFQLVQVPEPSIALLGGFGVLGLLRRRRH